ncbi:MAG: FAD-dependent oxidoreductase [Candidatus Omnitrophota bacterium]
MGKKKIIILGGGLAGLSVAWHLQKKGVDCRILEMNPRVGGLCRSKQINGFTFDYCGHLLHFRNSYSFNLVNNLLKNNLGEHKKSAWIYSYGKFSRYPFQANLYGLPEAVVKECLLGLILASRNGRLKNKTNTNFLEWCNHVFGDGITRHFMTPYNTKFWTLSPKHLSCDWLEGFVPVPSLDQVVEGTITESQRQFGYNARFWYPREGGINSFCMALASQIKNINTGCQVTEIDLLNKQIEINSRTKEGFDFLISTIPLPEMPCLIKGMPKKTMALFDKLRWNSIFNLNLGISDCCDKGQHWVYFPQQEISFFRVGFPHNFSSRSVPKDKSSLYVEVAYSKKKPIDKNNIILRIKNDLIGVGILKKGAKIDCQDTNDIKYGYPIYDLNYKSTRGAIMKFLEKNDIAVCGRYGSWRYMSMEDTLMDALRLAKTVKA